MAAKWLIARWKELFPALEQATTEQAVQTLCTAEIEAWRARPEIKQESSLRNPMTETRKEIETRLTGERRTWALTHLAFSREWYILHNAPSKDRLAERLTHQRFITDPEAIVSKATALLDSNQWADIVVGIAVCTGRRLGEALQTGIFTHKTMYTVTFEGALKRQKTPLPAFELPTLCTAQAIIDAVARLRSMLDTTDQDIADVTRKYSPLVKEAANRHFSELVPAREGRASLYSHLFRTVYVRIAVHWYAPPSVADTYYMSLIHGHAEEYEELETEELRQSYASNANYSDYRIADTNGNIDGRQGIKLGLKGVELLEVLRPKPRKEKQAMTTDTQDQTITQEPKAEGKNRPLTVDADTFKRASAVKARLQHTRWGETINYLIDVEEQAGPAPTAGTLGLAETIALVLAQDETFQKFKAEKDTADAVSYLETALAGKGFQAVLVSALVKEAKFQAGINARYAGKDFSAMTFTQLSGTRDIGATYERIIRAILAINAYNDEEGRAETERFFINTTTVHKLSSGRYTNVTKYLDEHRQEVDTLNAKYSLTDRYNVKPYSIESKITIPDEPRIPAASPEQAPEPAEATATE